MSAVSSRVTLALDCITLLIISVIFTICCTSLIWPYSLPWLAESRPLSLISVLVGTTTSSAASSERLRWPPLSAVLQQQSLSAPQPSTLLQHRQCEFAGYHPRCATPGWLSNCGHLPGQLCDQFGLVNQYRFHDWYYFYHDDDIKHFYHVDNYH